jgi:hypothetical protein
VRADPAGAARDDGGGEQPGDAGRCGGERGLVAPAALVQPRADAEQEHRRAARHDDAGRFADPSARRGDHEEEEDPDEHGEPADPSEHPPADEVLQPRGRDGRHDRTRVARRRGTRVARRCRRLVPTSRSWESERAGLAGRGHRARTTRRRSAAVEPGDPRLQAPGPLLQRRHPLLADHHLRRPPPLSS